MLHTRFDSFNEAYYALVNDTYNNFSFRSSPRGMQIKENLFVSFTIMNPRDRLLFLPDRKFSLQYVMAEILWYLSGNNMTDWISNYSSFWKDISDDGQTANSAYGARIFKNHPYQRDPANSSRSIDFTQWEYVKQELSKDPDSRRAVMHIRQPQDSYLATKDVPCTLSLQFFIRQNKLHLIVQMRSNDLILGTALDVPAFTFMQEMMALELGVELGEYHHTSNSMHVYERHFEMCEKIIRRELTTSEPMPRLEESPPVDTFMQLEDVMRKCTLEELEMTYDEITERLQSPLHRDWMIILLAHRAKKLGSRELESSFNSRLTLDCFKKIA